MVVVTAAAATSASSSAAKGESLDNLLTQISDSIKLASTSIDSLSDLIDDTHNYPDLIKSLINNSSASSLLKKEDLEGVSLLSLKNSSMLSYLNNLSIILNARVNQVTVPKSSKSSKDNKSNKLIDNEIRNKAIENAVTQRVILDKGVKSLEKKLGYQLDKFTNAYRRREKETNELTEKKTKELEDGDEDEDNEDEDDEGDEDDEDNAFSFRPDASAMIKASKGTATVKQTGRSNSESADGDIGDEDGKEASSEKYKPPKISAMLPPTNPRDIDSNDNSGKRRRNLQSMDEYLAELGDAPTVEHSIGATIIDSGRSMKTDKDRKKEEEITRYEEDNFTRLPTKATKISAKEKAKKKKNEFFGEDWSMFDNTRDFNESASRKRKPGSAWDRAKRRKNNL
ncbi:hypothetical protein BVG19_g4244 [[Candida] boidinii]|nr:hypothetical protein BVG19_g4244 [[Candida] boidinii]OWB53349.1 hypothetical protein B5S27_g4944 [[Candida] boidinii]